MKQRTERMLWGIAISCVLLTIVGWRYGTPKRGVQHQSPQLSNPTVMMFDEGQIAAAAEHITQHNPFRLNRSPANVPFGTPDVPLQPPVPQPPSPAGSIVLKGIVGGPPWQAILGGVPGRTANVVVSVGDTLAGVRIKRVQRDRVVLIDKDSVITLTLQRVWQ